MTILTGQDIWGPEGEQRLVNDLVQMEEAKVNVERAKRAGLDMGRQSEELEAASEKLRSLIREYYPNAVIPAVTR